MAEVPKRSVSSVGRIGRLALAFQEPLTTIIKVKSVDNPEFRDQILKALEKAGERAEKGGYTGEDVRTAKFAVVAFLDEEVLHSENPKLAGWTQVQSEWFGTFEAGKIFFQNLETIRSRGNSPDVADLLEVYDLCLLLGFLGEYRVNGEAGIPALISGLTRKILHIRKDFPERKLLWPLPDESLRKARRDAWIRPLLVAAVASVILSVALWFTLNTSLQSGMQSLRSGTRQSLVQERP